MVLSGYRGTQLNEKKKRPAHPDAEIALGLPSGDDIAIVAEKKRAWHDPRRCWRPASAARWFAFESGRQNRRLRSATDAVEAEGVRRARKTRRTCRPRCLYSWMPASARWRCRTGGGWNSGVARRTVRVTGCRQIKSPGSGIPARLDDVLTRPRMYLSARLGRWSGLMRTSLANERRLPQGTIGGVRRPPPALDALNRARHTCKCAADSWTRVRAFELFAEGLRLAATRH